MRGRSRTGPRPYSLGPLRFPVKTVDEETVYIVKSELVGGRRILTAEDGRTFIPSEKRLKVEPIGEQP